MPFFTGTFLVAIVAGIASPAEQIGVYSVSLL